MGGVRCPVKPSKAMKHASVFERKGLEGDTKHSKNFYKTGPVARLFMIKYIIYSTCFYPFKIVSGLRVAFEAFAPEVHSCALPASRA